MEAPSGLPANLPEEIRVKKDSAETKFLMKLDIQDLRRNEGRISFLEYLKPGTKKPRSVRRGFTKPHNLSVREELMV
jgi:hypothetical protein